MTKFVMKAIGFANGAECPIAGQYLKSFDFNAYEGIGFGVFTDKKSDAMKFDSFIDVFEFWKTVSPRYPLRADGQPNRPLTATTVGTEKLDD